MSFTEVWDVKRNTKLDDMHWNNIPLLGDGTFHDGGQQTGDFATISGAFLGPNHEEVGGVFDRDHIVGAFGAKQQ